MLSLREGAMMSTVHVGRFSARLEGPVTVFAIGMRVNRLWAVHRWWKPTINTLRMWRHVQAHGPDGYLGGYLYVYWRGVGMMQYWQDVDHLLAMAHDATQPHLSAWRQLVAQTGHDQTFGYWHETYSVVPGSVEAIYGSMPRFGLAAATTHEPIRAATESARSRLDGS